MHAHALRSHLLRVEQALGRAVALGAHLISVCGGIYLVVTDGLCCGARCTIRIHFTRFGNPGTGK